MVNYMLMINAELGNPTGLQPQGGCDDANSAYYFKLNCGNYGDVTQKETCVSLNETVPSNKGRGEIHLSQKCKFCTREGNGGYDQWSSEPLDFVFGGGWKVESMEGTVPHHDR